MEALFYSTGQVARELKTTLAAVRTMYENGVIAAETTPGGHLRFPASEVARLKKDGLPQMPRHMPNEGTPLSKNGNGKGPNGHPALLAAPSQDVVSASEDVVIAENRLKRRRLERELEIEEDWFSERAAKKFEIESAQREAERQRQAHADAARRHLEWENRWHAHALDSIPYDGRGQIEPDVHGQVSNVLATVGPETSDDIVRQLVDAAVAKALRPWTLQNEINRVVDDAAGYLPSEARSYFQPTPWQIRATQLSRAAVQELPDSAGLDEIQAAARGAVDRVAAEFREADVRKSVKQNWPPWSLLQHFSDDGKQMMREAVEKALADMPPGSSRAQLEAVCVKALDPFRQAVAKNEAEVRDREARQLVLMLLSFPWGLPEQDKHAATAAVTAAIAKLPVGTRQDRMEEVRDRTLQPFLDAHERRARIAPLVEVGLREIRPYVEQLMKEWEFEGKSALTLEAEAREPVRNRLEAALKGTESVDAVRKLVRRFVDEEFDEID